MLRIKCSLCAEIANNTVANNNKPRFYRTIVTSLTQLSPLENSPIVSINSEKEPFSMSLWSCPVGANANRQAIYCL